MRSLTHSLSKAAAAVPTLSRLHVSTACPDRGKTFAFCEQEGFLRVGWGTTAEPLEWDAYEETRSFKTAASTHRSAPSDSSRPGASSGRAMSRGASTTSRR